MSIKPTLDVSPQVGLANIQIDTLLSLNLHSSTEDKLKEIFGALQKHGRHIEDRQFDSIVLAVIKSNICHRTTHTRFAFGLYEKKTEINNHLVHRI
jgi:hypothetical protein